MEVDFTIPGNIPKNENIRRLVSCESLLGKPIGDVTVFREGKGINTNWYVKASVVTGEFPVSPVYPKGRIEKFDLPAIPISVFERENLKNGLVDVKKAIEIYYPELLREPVPRNINRYEDNIVVDSNGNALKVVEFNPYDKDTNPRSTTYDERVLSAIVQNLDSGEISEVKARISEYEAKVINSSMTVREATEIYLGDQLRLPAHYQRFHLPDGIPTERIHVGGGYKRDIEFGMNGYVSSRMPLTMTDQKALSSGLATKEQIAAKYLGREILAMKLSTEHKGLSQDISKSASRKI